jgi:hypothetical protein
VKRFLSPLLKALYNLGFEFAHHVFSITDIIPARHLLVDLITLFHKVEAQVASDLYDAKGRRAIRHQNAESFISVGL